jgi:hypothetical protein
MMPEMSQNTDLEVSHAPDEHHDIDVGEEKLIARQVDAALPFLRQEHEVGEVDLSRERRLLRKIDLLLMPFLFGVSESLQSITHVYLLTKLGLPIPIHGQESQYVH